MPKETLVEVRNRSGAEESGSGAPSGSWWHRYFEHGLRGLSPTAVSVVEDDSRLIVSDCIPPPSDAEAWPETRVRTGMVVGGVQSGKTASMLAISALLLDRGLDLLVVLGGTRIALWQQTYERLLSQLDGSTPEAAGERWSDRVLVPEPLALLRGDQRAPPTTYMAAAGSKIEHALRTGRPCILVIPKQEAHLLAVSRELTKRLDRVTANVARDIHMVVLDDEADDASVLDAMDSKTVPRRIEMLWTGKGRSATVSPRLFATYVAYTATPQANFLQQSHNPLAPRSFCAALRAPYKTGAVEPDAREPSFAEPEGIRRYYCGGEFFYREVPADDPGSLCPSRPFPNAKDFATAAEHASRVRTAADRMLLDGLRAYLVAGAIRLMEGASKGRLMPSEIVAGIVAEEVHRLPPPHCMLVHPSARQQLHADEARRLVLISSGVDPDGPDAPTVLDPAGVALDVEALRDSIASEPAAWLEWLGHFRSTLYALAPLPGAAELYLPAPNQEQELLRVLSDEVVPYVQIRIINSDPASDDRPQFAPVPLDDGRMGSPPDLLTIFVSGNVMSRGITIEGLCSSVFTRPADEPAADTQMQMQRWFGYRGSHAHLCRVFTFEDQLELFRTYHEHDVAIRTEILAGMDRGKLRSPEIILQGPRSLATAKIPTTRLPLHPGPTPSVKLLEADDAAASGHNASTLADLLGVGSWVKVGPEDQPRGVLRQAPASLVETAEILESLRFAAYDPDPQGDRRFRRWASLEDQLSLLPSERPLFRPPGERSSSYLVDVRACPYTIAAYLRLWSVALKRMRCDGLYPSDAEGRPWSLEQPTMIAPSFYVGVAFGASGPSRWPTLASLGVHAMKRGEREEKPRMVNTLWGRRGESGAFYGDQLFDYNFTHLQPPQLLGGEPVWRKRGHPGLLLFHVIRADDAPFDAVTVGLAIPHGGPEQFAALPAHGGRS